MVGEFADELFVKREHCPPEAAGFGLRYLLSDPRGVDETIRDDKDGAL